MKLSPLDVEHKEFASGLTGYNKKQVREYLINVAEVLEDTLRENQRLRDKLSEKDTKIEELQVAEEELKRAIIGAERIGNELRQNAKREADLILHEAETLKVDIIRDAEDRLKQASGELTRLERENRLFREQFRGMLMAYERSLDNLPEFRGSKPSILAGDANTNKLTDANPVAEKILPRADTQIEVEPVAESMPTPEKELESSS